MAETEGKSITGPRVSDLPNAADVADFIKSGAAAEYRDAQGRLIRTQKIGDDPLVVEEAKKN